MPRTKPGCSILVWVHPAFVSGIQWLFRRAFADFDFEKVARFNSRSVERLLKDASIVRHRGKIEATINNAKRAVEMVEREGSLAAFFWRYEEVIDDSHLQMLATTETSKTLSKELKKRGWKFVGPTTVYAFMQAMGLVNDHAEGCAFREKVRQAREAFTPPT